MKTRIVPLRKRAMTMTRQNLRDRREELGISQEEMADMLGVDRSTYVRYETGLRTPPLQVAIRIAEILKSDIPSLFAPDVPIQPKGVTNDA